MTPNGSGESAAARSTRGPVRPWGRGTLARPTGRGWLCLAGALALGGAGRLLGVAELLVAATTCLALVGGALVYVQLAPVAVQAERRLDPARVHLHRRCRVELALTNLGRRASPVLVARDHVEGGPPSATMLVGRLAPSERATVSYRLPTPRRGVFEVGPLEVELRDPFGVAGRRVAAAPPGRLVVFPRIEVVSLPTAESGDELAAHEVGAGLLGRRGDELYALRPYAVGDDLRRVHWRSSAHLGELMVRQDRTPQQGGLLLLVDLRQPVHTEASVERVISIAASLAVAATSARRAVRLVTTEGFDSAEGGRSRASADLSRLLYRLAVADWSSPTGLGAALARARRNRSPRQGLVVITTTAALSPDVRAFSALGQQFGSALLVSVEHGEADAGRPPQPSELGGFRVVSVGADQPLAAAWATTGRSTAGPRQPLPTFEDRS